MTEEKIQWISREKRKQVAFVSLLCLSSALIAFAPRNERRLFTVPQRPAGYETIAAPEETTARSAIFGAIEGEGWHYGERNPRAFLARTPGGQVAALDQPGAVRRMAAMGSPSALVAAVPGADTNPSALFAQPVVNDPAGTGANGTPGTTDGGSPGGRAPAAQPLPVVPPSAVNNPQQDPQPGAVPEPSTWLMMLSGFGLAGWLLRRRFASAAAPVVQQR